MKTFNHGSGPPCVGDRLVFKRVRMGTDTGVEEGDRLLLNRTFTVRRIYPCSCGSRLEDCEVNQNGGFVCPGRLEFEEPNPFSRLEGECFGYCPHNDVPYHCFLP